MIPRRLTWLRRLVIVSLVAAVLLLPAATLAQAAVTVQIEPLTGSGVRGTAILTTAGEGTSVVLDVEGLAPGAEVRVTMQAGTCAMPSASFAELPGLTADATGRAEASGSVLFHSTESVALTTMADGQHVILVRDGDQVLACGVIPPLPSDSGASTLPVTGGSFPGFAPALALFGIGALSLGLFLQRRRRTSGC